MLRSPVCTCVKKSLPFGKLSVARPAARYIIEEVVVLGAYVVENHIAVLRLPCVLIIVNTEIIGSRGNDTRKCRCKASVLRQCVVEFGFILVFIHSRL